jgi:Flp pilus assembly protein TadG
MKRRYEKGQALLLVVVAMGIFLIGALGLAVDGAQMYGHRQMAQAAADAGAQAGIMSIFNGTAGTGASAFPTSGTFNCAVSDLKTPCKYAAFNRFGGTAADIVTVDYPDSTAAPGVTLAASAPVNLIRVTVQRTIDTGLIRFLGPSTSTVKAVAIAAIVDVFAPVPILVTHPTLSGALSTNGGPTITICGGPTRSIQVNSSSATSLNMNSNTTIDLSKAGPLDSLLNPCTTGTGADFGDFGGPGTPNFTFVSGVGKFVQPASPILDPLASVPEPAAPAAAPAATALANNVSGCPVAPPKPCKLYSPGLYAGGISIQNETAVFKPGLYYMEGGGFKNRSNGMMVMATGFASDPNTGAGMVVYNHGAGTFDVGSNSAANLVGSDAGSIYKSILFFEDRNAPANTGVGGSDEHRFGGGGEVFLKGTIYISNSLSVMTATAGHYQNVLLQGTPGSNTRIVGEIIVSTLKMGGNAGITMQLDATATLNIRQVALVK